MQDPKLFKAILSRVRFYASSSQQMPRPCYVLPRPCRGITQDLGFSSFMSEAPEHLKDKGINRVQFTLVDCPGHASLIRCQYMRNSVMHGLSTMT